MAVKATDLKAIRAELEAKVAELAKENKVPGVAVGIYSGGEELYIYHGVTSIENPLDIDGHTLFQIGSTTKTFTATAIMKLVELGKIDLDAPVRKYIPELELKDEDVAKKVTVKQLLNHTAGWNGDVFDDTGDGDDALAKFIDIMARLEQVTPLGSTFSYNNASFAVAGRVIEKVTGKTYEAAVKELVLDPLGLTESLFFPNDIMTHKFVQGHAKTKDVVKVTRPWHMARTSHPMGGIAASAPDQIRYAKFHLGDGEGVLKKSTLDLMKKATFEIHHDAMAETSGVGICWLLRDLDGVRIVAHGGTTVGQLSAFALVPERDFAITVMSNSNSGGAVNGKVVEWVFENFLGLKKPEEVKPLDLSAKELAEFEGKYSTEVATLTVNVEGDHLVINIAYDPEVLKKVFKDSPPESKPINVKIIPGDGALVIDGDGKGGKFHFVRGDDKKISGLHMGRLAVKQK
jgi:CubicO group peptidase (beta-lactamase class C family)